MINLSRRRVVSFSLGIFAALLIGCASSPPVKFYQLNALSSKAAEKHEYSSPDRVIIGIGPLSIPDYLDRPQIVTRTGKNELRIADFDRWAGSLENDISRVLVENVSTLLPPDRFFVTRWTPLLENYQAAAYKVTVSVDRFEGTLGESAQLKAQWVVSGKERRPLTSKASSFVEQVKGNTYEDLVDAMSRTLERLSRDIAAAIGNLPAWEDDSPPGTK